MHNLSTVIPAKAGIQSGARGFWIPLSLKARAAGMTTNRGHR